VVGYRRLGKVRSSGGLGGSRREQYGQWGKKRWRMVGGVGAPKGLQGTRELGQTMMQSA